MRVIFVDYVKTDVELGRADMVAVPRVGETVTLELSYNPLAQAVFFVKKVVHEAKNTLKVETWMTPYDDASESGAVIVHVTDADKETREYMYRVIGYKRKEQEG